MHCYDPPTPPRYVSAKELSRHLVREHGIRVESGRLVELADTCYLPHSRVEGGAPMFLVSDAVAWVRRNLVGDYEGRDLPKSFGVFDPETLATKGNVVAPRELMLVADHLNEFPLSFLRFPCVYFLVRAGRVVYVGSSVAMPGRIMDHLTRLEFDRVFYMRVTPDDMLQVETLFIKTLRPEHNKGNLDGCRFHDYPAMIDRYCSSTPDGFPAAMEG